MHNKHKHSTLILVIMLTVLFSFICIAPKANRNFTDMQKNHAILCEADSSLDTILI